MTDNLHENQYAFFIISRAVLLRIRNVSDKRCTENNKQSFSVTKFSKIVPFTR